MKLWMLFLLQLSYLIELGVPVQESSPPTSITVLGQIMWIQILRFLTHYTVYTEYF